MSNEVWKDIAGYEGIYQVSNMGRVRSLPHTRIELKGRKKGKQNHYSLRILRPNMGNRGYYAVVLNKDGKRARWEVHRLVARTFLGPLPDNYHTHHVNGNSADNRLENLVYLSASEHMHLTHRGENCHKAILTEADVFEVRRLLDAGHIQKEIAAMYGVCRSTIGEIKRGKSWAHI
jgi:uncharacterized protein YerC